MSRLENQSAAPVASPSPPPLVSVVVPVHNREDTIGRAVRSALEQTVSDLEVIVVDDASTDGTRDALERIRDPRLRVLRHEINRAASVARNTGVDAARGRYVAFLDSDDEWLPEHVATRLARLESESADGVFGSFHVQRRGRWLRRDCPARRADEPLVEYILSGRGDVRSSTLLFRREAIRRLRFDPDVRKHQDWDLAARADRELRMACDPAPTAVLHWDVAGRMTAALDHEATASFLARHGAELHPRTLARFHTLHALRTLEREGRSPGFRAALHEARRHRKTALPAIRVAQAFLRAPGLSTVFVRLYRLWARLRAPGTSRPRGGPPPPQAARWTSSLLARRR